MRPMQKALDLILCKMHRCGMRSHSDIVTSAGIEEIARLRGVSVHTVRSWAQRDGIPAEHWTGLVAAEHATLNELAEYAAANPRKRPAPESAAA